MPKLNLKEWNLIVQALRASSGTCRTIATTAPSANGKQEALRVADSMDLLAKKIETET